MPICLLVSIVMVNLFLLKRVRTGRNKTHFGVTGSLQEHACLWMLKIGTYLPTSVPVCIDSLSHRSHAYILVREGTTVSDMVHEAAAIPFRLA